MKKLLYDFNHVESNIDDWSIYTKDWDTHLQMLDKLLSRLQQVHLVVWPIKYLFGSKLVEFLSHLVGGNCITINKENLEKICQAKRPTTKKEV